MTQKTKAQLKTDIDGLYVDNITGDTKNSDINWQQNDIADSLLGLVEEGTQTVGGTVNFTGELLVGGNPIVFGQVNVTVNSEDDLPAAVGGVRTLATGTSYILSGAVSSADEIVFSSGSNFIGTSSVTDNYTYTGTGTAFAGVNNSIPIKNLLVLLTGAGATLFDGSDNTDTRSFNFTDCQMIALAAGCTFGNVDGARFVGLDSVFVSGFDNPMTLDGDITRYSFSRMLYQDMDNLIKLEATATINSGDIDRGQFVTNDASDTVIVDDGATINSQITFSTCFLEGPGTFDNGALLEENKDYRLNDNTGFSNSHVEARAYTKTNTTSTSTVLNTPVLVDFDGSILDGDSPQMEVTTDGRIYNRTKDIGVFSFAANIFAEVTGGADRHYNFYFAKNGTAIDSSVSQGLYDGTKPHAISLAQVIDLDPNDYVEIYVEAITSATNITVEVASISANLTR